MSTNGKIITTVVAGTVAGVVARLVRKRLKNNRNVKNSGAHNLSNTSADLHFSSDLHYFV
ncbi:MAG: hypothetical protein NW207_07035 [Cytophagales bacterium]|nr:hypothetical protein [Cytophagales bacterium]